MTTFVKSRARLEPYVGFILAALGWFVISSLMSVWHTWNTLNAPSVDKLIWYVATYQAPLRDMQIHGLALFMIVGVSLKMLPGLFGLPTIPERRAWWALDFLTTALVGETALFLAYRWTGNHAFAIGLTIAWFMLLIGIVLVAWPWRLWRPFPEPDRSGKFVRAAYAWLLVSLLLLFIMPFYLLSSGQRFSHAYLGATRHAITVGFVSLMIMGMAAKVVPTLNGVDPRKLSALWGPFLLVNSGCLLRVSAQTMSDWTPHVYPLLGVSGTLEVAGIAWWGTGLIGLIWNGGRVVTEEFTSMELRPERVGSPDIVADVLAWFPETEPVFLRYGFSALKQPLLRKTIARQVSIGQAAKLRGVAVGELLEALNRSIARSVGTPSEPLFPILTKS